MVDYDNVLVVYCDNVMIVYDKVLVLYEQVNEIDLWVYVEGLLDSECCILH
jgi:hypothetical protein